MGNLVLNLVAVVTYLWTIELARLDGLFQLITDKMAELNVSSNWKAVRRVKASIGQERPTGSLAAVTAWVRSLGPDATDDQKSDLQTLQAVISQRFEWAGYVPKAPPVEEPKQD